MRNDPAEILREFLDGAFHPARAESLVSPDAVLVDLPPTRNAVRRAAGSGTLVGKNALLKATIQLLLCHSSGELAFNSLFGSGGSVAGFCTRVRCAAPDLSTASAPLSIWATASTGRARLLRYMEVCVRLDGQESRPARGARPEPAAARPEGSVIYLTYKR